MSFELEEPTKFVTVSRAHFDDDLVKQASRQILDPSSGLWVRSEDIAKLGYDFFEEIPENPKHAPYIAFNLSKDLNLYRRMNEEFSAVTEVLRFMFSSVMSSSVLRELYDKAETPSDYDPTPIASFTINICRPDQVVGRHRDWGDVSAARLACIATLQGRGDFIVYDGEDGKDATTTTVKAGDLHLLFNPNSYQSRLEHEATNTGDETRVSIGTQLRIPAHYLA